MKQNDILQANNYDAIVVGGGHAGIEAALALSRLNQKTLVLCINLDSIGLLACNPSIGGTAKGHLVREIDALGGEMGVAADKTMLQLKMLNRSKGAAVRSLRAQTDKYKYHSYMKSVLENTPGLCLRQAEVKELIVDDGQIKGVKAVNGLCFYAQKVVLACGVYLRSKIIIGDMIEQKGPSGLTAATHLSASLLECGIELRRFKTGTPARVHRDSIDLSKLEVQYGEGDTYSFSALSKKVDYDKLPCYLGYTNQKTHEVIKNNLHRAPMYSGKIEGTGARYCPSIEDKIVRFADKQRHQFFLEPEGYDTKEMYVQGISTSLPADVQFQMYRTIEGFENVEIMRDAYAIEYDCIDSTTLKPSLESKQIKGLYFAGQINGTSGYEEAAAQGLLAGINAALALQNKEPLVLGRENAYIGVLIDDLVTKGTNEPYRMMTGRAEYRLCLRQDNADSRLTEIGYKIGLATKKRYNLFLKKQRQIKDLQQLLPVVLPPSKTTELFKEAGLSIVENGITLKDIFKRDIDATTAKKYIKELQPFSLEVINQVAIDAKYEGYLVRQDSAIAQTKKVEQKQIPADIDFNSITGIRIEARQKLSKIQPRTLGQASRISGVSPADINVLILYLASLEK